MEEKFDSHSSKDCFKVADLTNISESYDIERVQRVVWCSLKRIANKLRYGDERGYFVGKGHWTVCPLFPSRQDID